MSFLDLKDHEVCEVLESAVCVTGGAAAANSLHCPPAACGRPTDQTSARAQRFRRIQHSCLRLMSQWVRLLNTEWTAICWPAGTYSPFLRRQDLLTAALVVEQQLVSQRPHKSLQSLCFFSQALKRLYASLSVIHFHNGSSMHRRSRRCCSFGLLEGKLTICCHVTIPHPLVLDVERSTRRRIPCRQFDT